MAHQRPMALPGYTQAKKILCRRPRFDFGLPDRALVLIQAGLGDAARGATIEPLHGELLTLTL
jgi:hypothetical protein